MPDYQAVSPDLPLHSICSACGHPLEEEGAGLEAEATPITIPLPPSSSVQASRFPPGALLADRYRIVEMLGRGGTGEVYRAHDLTLDHPVALKLFAHIDDDHGASQRLHAEVRLARQISHGNVCRVFDIGEASGHPFITMEFVGGEDLHALLRRIGRFSTDKALQVSRQLCAGLAAAHEAGVLHRDLKPANIMLDARGNIRITDFGLAVLAEGHHEANAGTPGYMAPEQLAGKVVTVRSDIYALGLVLHELFTGKRALDPRRSSDLVRGARRRVPPLSMPGVHPFIQEIVARCLDPNPAKRPESVVVVAAVLSRVARLEASIVPRMPPALRHAAGQQESTLVKLAWRVLGTSLVGGLFLLILAPMSTGVGLTFDMQSGSGSSAQVFSWIWCIALQLLIALSAMALVLKKHPQSGHPTASQLPEQSMQQRDAPI